MSEPLAPGPAFLVNLVEMERFVGRVVDVIEGPMFAPAPGEADWWYSIDASWLREQFPNAPLFLAPRHHLLPITPPPELAPSRERVADEAVLQGGVNGRVP